MAGAFDPTAVDDLAASVDVGSPEDIERTRRRNLVRDKLIAAVATLRTAGNEPATTAMTNAEAQLRIRRLERAVAALIALQLSVPSSTD